MYMMFMKICMASNDTYLTMQRMIYSQSEIISMGRVIWAPIGAGNMGTAPYYQLGCSYYSGNVKVNVEGQKMKVNQYT